ncbi:hypothetical protein JKF63_07881 [Porcisia hertigi]|uniref:Uncharacterized protein n=1 Tax=Porcisia hertigi TaxID=2761500 RepID=A0A836YGI8_9TRYP|nr:hypothetical protein JKF63_07881 [Porcisia hertigi]
MALTVLDFVRWVQSRKVAVMLLSMIAAWHLRCIAKPSATMAVAQGSASTKTGLCSFSDWATTLPPSGGEAAIVYPPDSVAYHRQSLPTPSENPLSTYWFVSIGLIVSIVCGFYILLALLTMHNFQMQSQHQAKKVIPAAYATKGHWSPRSKGHHGEWLTTRTLGSASVSSLSHPQRSASYSDTTSSYSDNYSHSSEESSPSSEENEDDAIAHLNPLTR